ncbi:MAG: alanyl-tRNA editing protein [Deltaproteobacteria bacterium]|nr:MAG: alanyl-tRNA editing protein [Deltaproteobacteria bacterium]
MTQKLFWSAPYLDILSTTVSSVKDDLVTLQETIFYAFSGGQESDSGTIGGYPVVEAMKEGMEILYRLPKEHELKAGDKVEVKIDWDRRYRLMRLHFAAELVLELAYRKLEGVEKIGAHISSDKARLDFMWPESLKPLLPELASLAQDIVDKDIEITSAFSDEENQLRYWEVPGFATVPCGGTHLKSTGEVGRISLKRNNLGKSKERIDIYVD